MKRTFRLAVVTVSSLLLLTGAARGATLTTLYRFSVGSEFVGYNPRAGLIIDAAGNLYGTTAHGPDFFQGSFALQGSVFKFEPVTGQITTLAAFDYDTTNGAMPLGDLLADAAGNLYGTTWYGGANEYGTVFRVEAGTNTLTTLVSFDGTNGGGPVAGLIADAAGNLYGTTDFGTVFRLEAETNTLTTLASFIGPNGLTPLGRLIADKSGNLYGTTAQGGTSFDGVYPYNFGDGTVFRIDAATNVLTTLASFDGNNGSEPRAGLVADAAGNLYGTTYYGGAYDLGTIFRLEAGSNTLTTLVSFDGTNGRGPASDLIADAAGNLYGTTQFGGAVGAGTVFRLEAATNTLTTLTSFEGTYVGNSEPIAGLVADSAGNLYGTTTGSVLHVGPGTIFKISDAGFVVIPEPSALAMAVLGLGALLIRRRK